MVETVFRGAHGNLIREEATASKCGEGRVSASQHPLQHGSRIVTVEPDPFTGVKFEEVQPAEVGDQKQSGLSYSDVPWFGQLTGTLARGSVAHDVIPRWTVPPHHGLAGIRRP